MYYFDFQVVFKEVPGEISLCFSISGCPLKCEGCHSPHLWKEGFGTKLTENNYKKLLEKYNQYATCVLFMGGEWYENKLIQLLQIAKSYNYKTCLYTGKKEVSGKISNELTWLKTGEWIAGLGGLNDQNTNQKFIDIKTNTNQNHLFIKT